MSQGWKLWGPKLDYRTACLLRQTRGQTLGVSGSISEPLQIPVFLKVAVTVQGSGFLLTYTENGVSSAGLVPPIDYLWFFPTEASSDESLLSGSLTERCPQSLLFPRKAEGEFVQGTTC